MNSSPFRSRVHLLVIVAVLASFGLSLWSAGVIRAANNENVIEVDSLEDKINTDGFCTLREAIISATKTQASSSQPNECEAGSATLIDRIVLKNPGDYKLTRTDNGREDSSSTGDLDITSNVVISPTGPVTITAISGFTDRIFHILAGSVVISNTTIMNGNVSGDGGGIYNKGTLTLLSSTVRDNKAGGKGGGIYNAGTLTLTNDTLSGNRAKTDGGGLYNASGIATLNNVTIASNTANSNNNLTGKGGGVFGNGGNGGTVSFRNTIIADNFTKTTSPIPDDCKGTLSSGDYNLIEPTTDCTINGTTAHNIGLDPRLGTLAYNGGPTFTHALKVGSPALDAGDNATCAATDQRGVDRPQGPHCDFGPIESQTLN